MFACLFWRASAHAGRWRTCTWLLACICPPATFAECRARALMLADAAPSVPACLFCPSLSLLPSSCPSPLVSPAPSSSWGPRPLQSTDRSLGAPHGSSVNYPLRVGHPPRHHLPRLLHRRHHSLHRIPVLRRPHRRTRGGQHAGAGKAEEASNTDGGDRENTSSPRSFESHKTSPGSKASGDSRTARAEFQDRIHRCPAA